MSIEVLSADLAVVGGGASGMMCAASAASRGLKVIIIDPNRFLGRKLRITGKGRCNLTNNCEIPEFLKNIPINSKFLYSAINAFSPADTISFFEKNGLKLKTERGNRVFPQSDNANDVADLLVKLCRTLKVKNIHGCVKEIVHSHDDAFEVILNTSKVCCNAVCICTGGKSYPLTGSTGDGYRFAEQFGHTIIPCEASLVPLESDDAFCAQLQGLSLRNVGIDLYEENKVIYSDFGEMMFAHFGVTGPIILSASCHMKRNEKYSLKLDLKPGLDIKKLDLRILRDFEKYSNRDIKNALIDLAPSSLIPVLVRLSGIDENTKANSITKEQRSRLLMLFKEFPINITGKRPIDEAIITSGGVNTKEVNPRTMESKFVHNLYFAGEVLDVDGYTGGFNLQIAWSTGYLAGKSVLKEGRV